MKKGIGIYIGQKEIIAVSILLQGGVPQVGPFAIEPISVQTGEEVSQKPKNPFSKGHAKKILTPEAQTIARALRKIGASRAPVIAAFNPFQLVTRYFEMPLIPRKEWQDTARYEAIRYIPFKLSEMISDYHIVEQGHDSQKLSVTITAAKIDVLRNYVRDLREGSAQVRMVEPVFSALSRALSLGEKVETEKPYGFVFIDSGGWVNVTFIRAGVVRLSRDFVLSEDRAADETHFYEELKASFDFVRQGSDSEEVHQVFLAGSGELTFWSDFLTSVFKQTHFDCMLFPTRQDIPKNIMGTLMAPIGLALRALNFKSPVGDLSLLPPVERETKPERIKRIVGVEFLAAAFFFIFLRLLILDPYAAYLNQQLLKRIGPEAALSPELANQPIEILRMDRDKSQARLNQLQRFSRAGASSGNLLRSLSKSIPSSVWLEGILYQGGDESSSAKDKQQKSEKELQINGTCYLGNPEQELQAINNWLKALGENKDFLKSFTKVTLQEIKRERFQEREVSRFRVICE